MYFHSVIYKSFKKLQKRHLPDKFFEIIFHLDFYNFVQILIYKIHDI